MATADDVNISLLFNGDNKQNVDLTVVKDNDNATRVLTHLYTTRANADIRVRVSDGRVFHCHPVILAASSAYFQALFSFTSKYSSAKDSDHDLRDGEVSLTAVDADTFETVLQFVYTGTVSLAQQTAVDILKAANFLQITGLQQLCSSYLEDILSVDTWQLVWEAGVTNNIQPLVDTVEHFILNHLYDILDNARVSATELEKKFEERSMTHHLEKLRNAPNLEQSHLSWGMSEPGTLIVIIPPTFGNQEVIQCYSESTNKWLQLTRLPKHERVTGTLATVVSGSIYFTGGKKSAVTYSNQCHCFNTASLQWRQCAPMNIKHSGHVAVAVRRNLLVLGHVRGPKSNIAGRMEMYNAATDQWTLLEPKFSGLNSESLTVFPIGSSACTCLRRLLTPKLSPKQTWYDNIMLRLDTTTSQIAPVMLTVDKPTMVSDENIAYYGAASSYDIDAVHVTGTHAVMVTHSQRTEWIDDGDNGGHINIVVIADLFLFDSQRSSVKYCRSVRYSWPYEFQAAIESLLTFADNHLYCLISEQFLHPDQQLQSRLTLLKLDLSVADSEWVVHVQDDDSPVHVVEKSRLLNVSVPRHVIERLPACDTA